MWSPQRAVMIGMVFSTKPDDKDHPYGHEKIEAEVGKLLSMALMATGIGVGWASVNTIINGSYTKPGVLAAIAAVLSIIVKEWMYHYTVRAAKKINSPAMKADAWHHRSDALSSIGTLVGITGAMLGLPILDPLAGLIVCVMIMKVSFSIYVQSLNQLIDKAAKTPMWHPSVRLLKESTGWRPLTISRQECMGRNILWM